MAGRIDVRKAHDDLQAGALLICAYDSREKYEQNHLEDAISLDEFRARERSLSKDQELIFYCA